MPKGSNSGSTRIPRQDAHRHSGTGQFVTKDFADRHPKITEHERIKRPDWK